MEMNSEDDIFTIENGVLTKCNIVKKEADKVVDNKKDESENNAKCETLTIPKGVTKIGSRAFAKVNGVKKVVIGESVTEIASYAFFYCAFEEIEIGENVKEIGEAAFNRCKLRSIKLPPHLTKIAKWLFYNVESLEEIEIPASVVEIGENAFYGCSSLCKVRFGGTVAQWESVKNAPYLWWEIPAKEIICSDGVVARPRFIIKGKTIVDCLDKEACEISIPDGITRIETESFAGCSLKKILIPHSVVEIGNDAFSDCVLLKEIIFDGTKSEWEKVEKGYRWKSGVPAKSVKCSDSKAEKKSKYTLDLGGWTIEDALSCLNIEPGSAKKWELTYEEYRYGEDTDWNEEHESQTIGYFDTKESAVRYFFENKLYERVKDDYVSCIDCAVWHSELNEESSLEALRDAFSSGEEGKAYYDFYYSLGEVELEALVKPRKTDAEFLEANGIDLTIYEEDEEEDDDEENEEEMRRIEQEAYAEAFVPETWGMH